MTSNTTMNILLVGTGATGKTSYVKSLAGSLRNVDQEPNSLGENVYNLLYRVRDRNVDLKDGDERKDETKFLNMRFHTSLSENYQEFTEQKEFDGIIIMFDLTVHHTFEFVDKFYDKVKDISPNIVICGNMYDRIGDDKERKVSHTEMIDYLLKKRLTSPRVEIYEISNKSKYNIHHPIVSILRNNGYELC